LPGAIAAYRIEGPESTLVDPGPSPSLPALLVKLRALGLDPCELRHVVLTHIHLDHAGAAGDLVRMCPDLTVYVHVDGAPHLVDPERLVASTRRTFGDAYDRLYGEVQPIPPDRIRVSRPGETVNVGGEGTSLRAIPTPGHIGHHLAFLDERDGTLYAGDALGIRLAPEAPPIAPTPPPAIDLEAWFATLATVDAIGPERIAVTHFGMDPPAGVEAERAAAGGAMATSAGRVAVTRTRIRQFRAELLRLALRVRAALEIEDDEADAERYAADVRARVAAHADPGWVDRYFDVFSAANDYRGVVRYLTKNPQWHPPSRPDMLDEV
jgi:glyoxylase-like metal-dependent hydrolase (beta-lactamase superfamily II)